MPVEILGADGEASGVRFQRCTLGEPNERGWRPPVPVDGEFVEIEADTVIFAIGQALVDDFLGGADGVAVEKGQIAVDPDTMMTGRPAVFAGGDAAAMGPWTAIEAIAAGRRAARAMHNFLRGEQMVAVWDSVLDKAKIPQTELAPLEPQARRIMKTLDGVTRRTTWHEVRLGFSEEDAVAEAGRCLDCAVCADCRSCVEACPADAIDFEQKPSEEEITVGAVVIATGHKEFDATRKLPLGFGRSTTCSRRVSSPACCRPAGRPAASSCGRATAACPRRSSCCSASARATAPRAGNEHCSAICCLFATLHSSLIMQHDPDAEVTIAYTDLRAPGKAHEEYYRLVQSRGVRYVRGRIAEVVEEPDKSLRVRLEDTVTGRKSDELYDLVVLSAGLEASDGTTDIARIAGLQTGLRRFHQGIPSQAQAGRHPAPRHVRGRHGAGAQEHPRFDRPGQGRGLAGHGHALDGVRAHPGSGGLLRRECLHRLRSM